MERPIQPVKRLQGVLKAPGDRSISHRALVLGAMARGKQVIDGLADTGDVRQTIQCLRTIGCFVETMPDGRTIVLSKEFSKDVTLDAGLSRTTACLMAGLVSGLPLTCSIDGGAALKQRSIMEVIEPLSAMGARITADNGGVLPVTIEGARLKGISHRVPAGNRRVKSAVLIAGLATDGETTVTEETPTHDHTENIMRVMGVNITSTGNDIKLTGGTRVNGTHLLIPGDFSYAINCIVAASCLPDSEIYLPVTGINPTRAGALQVLRDMGADIVVENEHKMSGEAAADLNVRSAGLRGIEVNDTYRIDSIINELPILAVAASQADGETVLRGSVVPRQKDPVRIGGIVKNLSAMGAEIEELEDGLAVRGPTRLKGAKVSTFGDHRIAAAMVIAGMLAEGETILDDDSVLEIFYPRFPDDLRAIIR